MNLSEFRVFFKNALSEIYPIQEIDSFFFILISEYLGLQRVDTVLKPDFKIDDEQLFVLKEALSQLKKEIPIQYIIGKTEFYGYPFIVDKNTLIPRPETEELVEWIINEVGSLRFETRIDFSILDIGTGSGCMPIALAKNLKNATISAIDISADALKVAKKNADLNKVAINFLEVDILQAKNLSEKYNIIVSNPPYVRELEKVEIKNNVLHNEPHLALFVADENPLIFYNKIADLAKHHLKKNGLLFFEINQYLAKETMALLKQKGFKTIALRKDIFNNDRMIKATLF
jgi:release factor glutamine methyltransferase